MATTFWLFFTQFFKGDYSVPTGFFYPFQDQGAYPSSCWACWQLMAWSWILPSKGYPQLKRAAAATSHPLPGSSPHPITCQCGRLGRGVQNIQGRAQRPSCSSLEWLCGNIPAPGIPMGSAEPPLRWHYSSAPPPQLIPISLFPFKGWF